MMIKEIDVEKMANPTPDHARPMIIAASSPSLEDMQIEMASSGVSSAVQNALDRMRDMFAMDSVAEAYMHEFLNAKHPIQDPTSMNIPDPVQRVMETCVQASIKSRFIHVESDYYSWSLQKRAVRVGAPSKWHMCKTLIFENTRWSQIQQQVPHPQYYCVITQYMTQLNTQKLAQWVRSQYSGDGGGGASIPKSKINMRLASEHVSADLTGFERNGVAPLGMRCGSSSVPVVVERGVTELKPGTCILGGGDVDWKVEVSVRQLIETLNAHTIDLQ